MVCTTGYIETLCSSHMYLCIDINMSEFTCLDRGLDTAVFYIIILYYNNSGGIKGIK